METGWGAGRLGGDVHEMGQVVGKMWGRPGFHGHRSRQFLSLNIRPLWLAVYGKWNSCGGNTCVVVVGVGSVGGRTCTGCMMHHVVVEGLSLSSFGLLMGFSPEWVTVTVPIFGYGRMGDRVLVCVLTTVGASHTLMQGQLHVCDQAVRCRTCKIDPISKEVSII